MKNLILKQYLNESSLLWQVNSSKYVESLWKIIKKRERDWEELTCEFQAISVDVNINWNTITEKTKTKGKSKNTKNKYSWPDDARKVQKHALTHTRQKLRVIFSFFAFQHPQNGIHTNENLYTWSLWVYVLLLLLLIDWYINLTMK